MVSSEVTDTQEHGKGAIACTVAPAIVNEGASFAEEGLTSMLCYLVAIGVGTLWVVYQMPTLVVHRIGSDWFYLDGCHASIS